MNDIALLIAAGLSLFVTGYLIGLRDERHADDGTIAQRTRAVRAEQLAEDRQQRLNHIEARLAEPIPDFLRPGGGPGRARANRHGGLTAAPAPGRTDPAAAIFHFPSTPQRTERANP